MHILARLVRIVRANAGQAGRVRTPRTSPACRTRWNRRAFGPLQSVRPPDGSVIRPSGGLPIIAGRPRPLSFYRNGA
jgi:hypothetical protein